MDQNTLLSIQCSFILLRDIFKHNLLQKINGDTFGTICRENMDETRQTLNSVKETLTEDEFDMIENAFEAVEFFRESMSVFNRQQVSSFAIRAYLDLADSEHLARYDRASEILAAIGFDMTDFHEIYFSHDPIESDFVLE